MKCCNPSCDAVFDHREGRLIRFSGRLTSAKTLESRTFIQHYWLCGKCSETYVFDRKSSSSLKIKLREQLLRTEEPSEAVFAA
jgi:hypothetical protein